MAEWARRQKIEVAKGAPEGGAPSRLRDCILCLQEGRHIYSVAPDEDYGGEGDAKQTRGGSALTWSAACLRCDEYFYVTDSPDEINGGDRIVLRRFTNTTSEFPTMGAYYYEHRDSRLVWRFVADRDVDDTTWKLWHHALAGFKIASNLDEVEERLEVEGAKRGWSATELSQRKIQGMACFVSEKKGVRAVMIHQGHGLTRGQQIGFRNGEPFRPTGRSSL